MTYHSYSILSRDMRNVREYTMIIFNRILRAWIEAAVSSVDLYIYYIYIYVLLTYILSVLLSCLESY